MMGIQDILIWMQANDKLIKVVSFILCQRRISTGIRQANDKLSLYDICCVFCTTTCLGYCKGLALLNSFW